MYVVYINQILRRSGDQPCVVVGTLHNGGVRDRIYTRSVRLPDGAMADRSGIHLPNGQIVRVDPQSIRRHEATCLTIGMPGHEAEDTPIRIACGGGWTTVYAPLPGPSLKGTAGVRLWIEAASYRCEPEQPTIPASSWLRGASS